MSAVLSIDATADCPHAAAIESADATTHAAMVAIRAIPVGLFDERAAMNLISTLISKIAECGWRNQEHAGDAGGFLTDAFVVLENAAEQKECA